MKKVVTSSVLCIALFLLFSTVVSADSSSNELQVKILGCTDGVNFASVGQCLGSTGYCADHDTILDVYDEPNACSGGRTPQEGTLKDYQVCCPSKTHECVTNGTGYGAQAQPGDAYFCIAATQDCSDYSRSECEDDHFGQCFWYEGNDSEDGECKPRTNTCYEYETESACNADAQNVAIQDPNCRYGSSISGGIEYIIPQDTCECSWSDGGTPSDTTDDSCGLDYQIVPGVGDDPDAFSTCNFVLNQGECIDGFQDYTYSADFNENTLSVLPGDARCADRSGRRRCGEAIVKVSFFDVRNIAAIILLLGLFYILKIPQGSKNSKSKEDLF